MISHLSVFRRSSNPKRKPMRCARSYSASQDQWYLRVRSNGSSPARSGKLGKTLGEIDTIVEMVENPANALVSGLVNVQGVQTATESAASGQMPALHVAGDTEGGGGAIDVLTSTLALLETTTQEIEQAFVARRNALDTYSAEQWASYDGAAQADRYQQLLDKLDASAAGIAELKAKPVLAKVLERHLWARWLIGKHDLALRMVEKLDGIAIETPALVDVGNDIEDGLNAVGIAGLAGVTLSGHWYKDNSVDWARKLVDWANTYSESVKA